MLTHARSLTELGLLTYLVTIPMGRGLPGWARELPLLAILSGMILARVRGFGASQAAPYRFLGPLVLFGASTLLSALFSTFPDQSLARAAYVPIGFLLFLATQDVAVDLAAYRRVLLVFSAIVILLGLDGAYQFWTGASLLAGAPPFHGPGERIRGSLPNPNDLALIPILLPAALTVVALEPSAWVSRVIICGLPFALLTAILTASRNVWLGLLVGLGTVALFSSRRKVFLAAAAMAAALFVLILALDVRSVPERARTIVEIPRDPRIGHWLVAWQMFRESPLLGKGVHTFAEFYLPYLDRVEFPANYSPEVGYIPWAHNLYLEILAERGLVGAVGFGAFLLAFAVRLSLALMRQTPPEARAIALGLAASVLTFLIQGLFDLTFLKDWVLLVFLLLAALVARLPALDPTPR